MKKILFPLLLLSALAWSLPVGDPRVPLTPEEKDHQIPISQGKREYGLHVFGGLSKIDYPDVGGTDFSPGFGAQASFNYFFYPKWSVLLGAGVQLFNNRGTNVVRDFHSAEADGSILKDQNDFADQGNDKVDIYYNVNDYSETQWSLMAMIPIMLQYQSNELQKRAFYLSAGLKVGIPFSGNFEAKVGRAQICGYYPGYGTGSAPADFAACNAGGGVGEGFENLGFGDYGSMSSVSRLKFSTAFFGAVEAGIKWRIYKTASVYTGFWLDWALNDVALSAQGQQALTWTPYSRPNQNSLTPQADVKFNSRTNGRAVPMSMGFTVRVAIGKGYLHDVDTMVYVRKIHVRDSIIGHDKNLIADQKDTIDYLRGLHAAAMAALTDCNAAAAAAVQGEYEARERARIADSLARLAAEEAERQRKLASIKTIRIREFTRSLANLVNGLDDYKVTQTVPSDRAREKLDTVFVLLRDYPSLTLKIVGHTCTMGTHEQNLKYGIQRATGARNYLVEKGIDPDRITTETQAETQPVAPNDTEVNRRLNRRVELQIFDNGKPISEIKETQESVTEVPANQNSAAPAAPAPITAPTTAPTEAK